MYYTAHASCLYCRRHGTTSYMRLMIERDDEFLHCIRCDEVIIITPENGSGLESMEMFGYG